MYGALRSPIHGDMVLYHTLKICSQSVGTVSFVHQKFLTPWPLDYMAKLFDLGPGIFIGREAREIMHLVASFCPFVCTLTVEH